MVYDIIEQLRNESSLNGKRAILRENKDNEEFKEVLRYAYDPRLTYGIKKIPKYVPSWESEYSISEALEMLQPLIHREKTGNEAIEYLTALLSSLEEKDAKVIEQVIAKDFKAGFGVSLINKEMAPFKIYEVPYMGAISFNEKKARKIFEEHEFAFSEVKMDGRYINIRVQNKENEDIEVFLESRGGKPNPLMGALEEDAKQLREKTGFDFVLNGELMFFGAKNRYESNGIISSFVSIAQKHYDGKDISKEAKKFHEEYGFSLEEAKKHIKVVVWDMITVEEFENKRSDVPRKERIEKLEKFIEHTEDFLMVEYKKIYSYEEAMQHFHEMLRRGEEGTILKGSEGIWEDKKPNYQIKMKLEMNLDLRIVGFNKGTPGTKYEEYITSINVESEDGLLRTSPGGIKEKDMKYITEHQEELLGKLVEIKCSGLSQNSEGEWSCLHPAFLKIRDDKEKGDTLESCLMIQEMALGLKEDS
jgi:transcriptional regulator with XRE-family HTH domain